jgi:hypothetical protein
MQKLRSFGYFSGIKQVKREGFTREDDLKVLPTEKSAQVRSIQKHDDDFTTASAGERVGLALKNVETSDLERGSVLTGNGSMQVRDHWEGEAELSGYWKIPMKEGMVVHLGHWMQFVPARIQGATTGVDPLSRQQFWTLIDDIRKGRPSMSVVISTAYMDEAQKWDWIVAMDAGRVLATGTPAELMLRTGTKDLEECFIALLPEEKRSETVVEGVPTEGRVALFRSLFRGRTGRSSENRHNSSRGVRIEG